MAAKNRFADRGAEAEKQVKLFLERWMAHSVTHEANRLIDTKAAGRIIKAAAADFEYNCVTTKLDPEGRLTKHFGLIEVKETQHDYRLAHDRITQMPRLRKREKCGGESMVAVYHSTIRKWRCLSLTYLLANMEQGASWDLRKVQAYDTVDEALAMCHPAFAGVPK